MCAHFPDISTSTNNDSAQKDPTATAPTRNRRIDVRVTETQDATIREADALAGETLTTFLLKAVEERATALLEQRRHLTMSAEAFDVLVSAIDQPSIVAEELVELFTLDRLPAR